MKMEAYLAEPQHQVVYQELTELITRHHATVSAIQILAIASNLVGKLIAMQDQRRYTPDELLKLVGRNIEAGNKEVLDDLKATKRSD